MEHPEYKEAKDPQKADACAWVFKDEKTFCKYYYNHPPLESTHIRCRVLYAALCMSDSYTGRGSWGSRIRPLFPGHEVIAEVEAKSPDVTKIQIGDKVAFGPFRDTSAKCEFCSDGRTTACQNTPYKDKKFG